ncbi:MAG TPA: hypothetical protein QGG47_16150 [Acidobacteriota bacterium]|nr:hypothetical protein [Acidobacteriota bacterium]
MTRLSKLTAGCSVLLALPLTAQNPETVNPGTVLPDDSVALENQIRHSKFDQVLPRVMRDNEIDMWIHVLRPWTPDPLSFALGGDAGIFIFTDRRNARIERAVFAGGVDDAEAYDIIARPRGELPTFVDGIITEQPGGDETDYLEFRFNGVGNFVAERDPRRIAVNYSEALGLSAASERTPLTDGLSHTDYGLLMEALGDTYADRVVSAEHLTLDYLAGRVAEEIELYRQFGLITAANLDREFGKVVPGVTKLSDLEGNVFRRDPDGVEFHAQDRQPYVLQPGDVFTILHGAGNRIFSSDLGGNAYLLREGESKAPPEIVEVWQAALETRQILLDNIVAGRTAGETLDLLIERIEEAGYHYNPVDQYDPAADPSKTQVHLDVHAVSRSGLVAPRISPLGSDWEREMTIPVLHTFTFEYMIHMPVPAWGRGKHIYIAFHDGAVVTADGVEFPYPPDPGIRLIR